MWRSACWRRHPCCQQHQPARRKTQGSRHHSVSAGSTSVRLDFSNCIAAALKKTRRHKGLKSYFFMNSLFVLICSLWVFVAARTNWVRGGVRGPRSGQWWWECGVWRWQRPPVPTLLGWTGGQQHNSATRQQLSITSGWRKSLFQIDCKGKVSSGQCLVKLEQESPQVWFVCESETSKSSWDIVEFTQVNHIWNLQIRSWSSD